MTHTAHDLRCGCPHRTKLGEWGRNAEGAAYLHIRIFKGGRIFGEVLATSGTVTVLCRDCGRWMTVRIRPADVDVTLDVSRPVALVS